MVWCCVFVVLAGLALAFVLFLESLCGSTELLFMLFLFSSHTQFILHEVFMSFVLLVCESVVLRALSVRSSPRVIMIKIIGSFTRGNAAAVSKSLLRT